MEFGLRIPPCEDPRQVADLVLRAEQAGFGYAWIPDSQLLWRDLWVTLGVIAARTSRIILGTNVTNPLTRDVTVTASAAAAMDEVSDGRFILGYGSGDSSVRVMGWKTSRIEVMRTSIATMRTLWRGETAAPHGQPVRLAGAPGRDIPVYVSATGPRMLSFAARPVTALSSWRASPRTRSAAPRAGSPRERPRPAAMRRRWPRACSATWGTTGGIT